jgi:hypothetical protein
MIALEGPGFKVLTHPVGFFLRFADGTGQLLPTTTEAELPGLVERVQAYRAEISARTATTTPAVGTGAQRAEARRPAPPAAIGVRTLRAEIRADLRSAEVERAKARRQSAVTFLRSNGFECKPQHVDRYLMLGTVETLAIRAR